MKKVKLFTTIASLCLAVALMAFGVYAAQSVSTTVKGSISFTSTEVDVEITSLKWYASNITGAATDLASAVELFDAEDGLQTEYSLGELKVATVAENDGEGTMVPKAATIYIVCTVKNNADAVAAQLTATIDADTEGQYKGTANPTKVKVEKSSSNSITATITFTPASVDTSGTPDNFSVLFSASKWVD